LGNETAGVPPFGAAGKGEAGTEARKSSANATMLASPPSAAASGSAQSRPSILRLSAAGRSGSAADDDRPGKALALLAEAGLALPLSAALPFPPPTDDAHAATAGAAAPGVVTAAAGVAAAATGAVVAAGSTGTAAAESAGAASVFPSSSAAKSSPALAA